LPSSRECPNRNSKRRTSEPKKEQPDKPPDAARSSRHCQPITLSVQYFRNRAKLYQTLYNLFTISELSDEQRSVLGRRWLRIFTTNYDDAIELAYQKAGIAHSSFDYSDPIPRKLPINSIIHIHGVIRKCNEDNVLDQLVLNQNSYIRQYFESSPWFGELDRAIDHCSACFFVGYSLSDYHIAALLLQKPQRKEKIFFITKDIPAEIPRRQLEQFGQITPIGLSGFSQFCEATPAPPAITDLRLLRGVKYLDPLRDNKAIVPPTPNEILRLVTYGDFNVQRCLTNLPAANYVVPREAAALAAAEEVDRAKSILLHSYLGNGKTVFIPILAYHLSMKGYRCFVCQTLGPEILQEIRALQDQQKPLIFFDSYDVAVASISSFEEFVPQCKYVVCVRTGVQEVRLHEIQDKFPQPVRRVSLNGLNADDRRQFRELLDSAGLLGKRDQEIIDAHDYREIVTSIYNHEGIRSRLKIEIEPLVSDERVASILIAGLLLSWIGQKSEPSLLRAITGRDPYVELMRFKAVASEIFKLDSDTLDVRSSIFAEYVLKTHCPTKVLLNVVERLIVTAVQRKRERGFQGILSKLMRVATLKSITSGPKNLDIIQELFEKLQRDIGINKEPLFWLQYAILMNEIGALPEAEQFLATAYKRAEAADRFETFQIDTYALRLLLRIEEESTAGQLSRFDQIIEKSELVLSMITDQNRRWHAIQVLEGFEPFVRRRALAMSTTERNAMVFQLGRLEAALNNLTAEARAETGSDQIKNSLTRARAFLVKAS
jgi:hypothetical protein